MKILKVSLSLFLFGSGIVLADIAPNPWGGGYANGQQMQFNGGMQYNNGGFNGAASGFAGNPAGYYTGAQMPGGPMYAPSMQVGEQPAFMGSSAGCSVDRNGNTRISPNGQIIVPGAGGHQ